MAWIGKGLGVSRFVLLLGFALLMGIGALRAQTFAEWFSQKKTQEKYLVEQIAALKLYGGYVKKGYNLVSSGLGVVRDLSNGEFKLHQDFFGALKLVNPALGGSVRMAELMGYQVEILKILSALKTGAGSSAVQLEHISGVSAAVLKDCLMDLETLLSLLGTDGLDLSDAERLSRLGHLKVEMSGRLSFVRDYAAQLGMLGGLKVQEEVSVFDAGRWYGQ